MAKSTFELNINGETRKVNVEASTSLLWVLREDLGLTGTKFGCGIAQCGACTVHRDGNPIRSCVVPVSAVQGSAITTIEGLTKDGAHPLVSAWEKEQVPQCGYCQSGQIMQAAALLAKEKRPSREQIVAHMNGVLCRCGTYNRIVKAIQRCSSET